MTPRRPIVRWLLAAAALVAVALGAHAQRAPELVFDPTWPKDLPDNWKLGGITGLALDRDENVWLYNRPNDLTNIELHAELDPPLAALLRARAVDDPSRPRGPRHRLVRRAAGSRHGRRQRRLRLSGARHGAQVRPAIRHGGCRDRARAGARGRRSCRAAARQPPTRTRRPRARRRVPAATAGRIPRPLRRRKQRRAAFRAKYPAATPDGRRADRGDPHRRGRQRGLRRRQLSRRPRARVRARHARVQARLGRLRQAAR